MVRGARDLRASVKANGRHPVTILRRSAAGIEHDAGLRRLRAPRLVVTSPPYPGVHVLYHRWQVDGRKEAPLPFMIANKLDGSGSSYYTMGDRKNPGLTSYFENITATMSSVAVIADADTIVVQMLAFSEASWQLPQYLECMEQAGLTEVFLPILKGQLDGRLWRSVPGRRWYNQTLQKENNDMPTVTTKDGTEIFYKDWGTGEPIFFHHGWPLSADDWDAQMMFFLDKGYRVIAHDRRGHGRSTQTATGHDMDMYADDAFEVVKKLDLKNAVHIGHSTGGGEVTRYVARHGKGRVKKAVLISAIPPLFMKTDKNPDGVPKEVVDGIRDGTANHRSQFYKDITMPFYGFNRPGATISEGIRENWWRQGMMGSIQAQYECIRVLSETEFYDDLAIIDVPVLVMHGEDDQICPFPTTGARSVKLLKHGTLKSYPGLPHGMPTTHADQINADLLAFIRS
jgi:non-heme chloroperoxidase